MLKASIVIPTYNRASFLGVALESALSQDYQNLEIVICDDCSTDNTKEIVQKYIQDERIIYRRNSENKGQMPNYFYVIKELACGDWVFTLADDDYFDSEQFISKAMQLATNEDIDMILTNTKIDLGDFQSNCHDEIHKRYNLKESNKAILIDAWKTNPEVLDSATAYKRAIFFDGFGDNHEESTMSLVEDFDLKIMNKRVGYLYDSSYVFTIGEHSLNKFKIDVYEFIIILKSFIRPINFAFENNLFTKSELMRIYLEKWAYYCSCTSFVSSVLDEAFFLFVKKVIENTEEINIYELIEEKAKEYSAKYQNNVDENIKKFGRLKHIYVDKGTKMERAKKAIIYGAKQRGEEVKFFLEANNITVICFIDDFSQKDTLDNLAIYKKNKLNELKVDLYIIASDNYTYIQNMYETLLSFGVDSNKIIA